MFHAISRDKADLGHSGLLVGPVLDIVFIVLGVALFGVTAAYAAACDRM